MTPTRIIPAAIVAALPTLAMAQVPPIQSPPGMALDASNAILPNALTNLGGLPHVATNALLAAAKNATYPNGVWRDHYTAGGFADGPLFFQAQSGTCASNSWVNDGGNCVDSTSGDGNSWKALHEHNILNVKEFGAKGDNATDDSAAIQAAVAAAASVTPGVFYDYVAFPSGNYCVTSNTTTTSARLQLVSIGNGIVKVCGAHDVTVLTLNGSQQRVSNLQIQGYNSPTATQPALSLGSSCIECIVEGGLAQYGSVPIKVAAGDAQIINEKALQGYGVAVAQATAGSFWRRDKFDQSWPTGTAPTAPVTLSAWAANHAYNTANEIVSIGTNSWILQKTSGSCTSSSGSEPAVAAYGTAITDGTCTWKLAQPYSYYALRLDTGASPSFVSMLDATGDFTGAVGLGVDGGGGPQLVTLRDINAGGPNSYGVDAEKGQGLTIAGGSATNCVFAGCKGVRIASTFGQNVHIGDGFEAYNNPTDVSLEGGTGLVVTGASLHGSSSACVDIAAGVSDFTIANNDLTTGAIWGSCTASVKVETGASDRYNIIGNLVSGTAPSDGGSGTNKTILGNH